MDQTKTQLNLEEAKANFKAALMEFDPVRIIKRKPIHVLGVAVLVGLLTGTIGKKISRAFLPGSNLISGIIKKLV
ncbi:MAG: hypothetical protein GXZ00_05210 [Synergistaceae bacterium]|nr:hypothetical protein [Synergistaceae bacterium]